MACFDGAVVVHFHSVDTIARTVADIEPAVPSNLVVVDNSGDVLDAGIDSDYVVSPPGNIGYGAAVNLGVRQILRRNPKARKILVCTHEIRVDIDSLANMSDALDSLDVGLVAPILLDSSKGSAPGAASTNAIWSQGGTVSLLAYPRNSKVALSPSQVEWADGACFAVNTRAWLDVGGLPEAYFVYFEDVAFGHRLRAAGYRIQIQNQAWAYQSANGPNRYLALRNRLIFADTCLSPLRRGIVKAEYLARLVVSFVDRRPGSRERGAELRRAIADASKVSRTQ